MQKLPTFFYECDEKRNCNYFHMDFFAHDAASDNSFTIIRSHSARL